MAAMVGGGGAPSSRCAHAHSVGGAEGNSSSLCFQDGAPHPPDPSPHSPPSKAPNAHPGSPKPSPPQVLAREWAAARQQERAQGCIPGRRMGRSWWGPQQPGDARVSLAPWPCAQDPRRAGSRGRGHPGAQPGLPTLTPSWGPGRHRAGTRTQAYIKNNNKNLLALQTAQPVQGDGLAWCCQISWSCPNRGETRVPLHARSLQQGTACTPEPCFQHDKPSLPNPTAFQTGMCFASLSLMGRGLLSLLKQCTPRSRGCLGQEGPPFLAGEGTVPCLPRREAWGRLETPQ